MEIKDRIEEFINAKGLTIKAFEQEIGISNGSWKKAMGLSEDVLLKTINRFPELNSDWLLKGKGEMLTSHSSFVGFEDLECLRNENSLLKKEIATLKSFQGNGDKSLDIAMKLYLALGEVFTDYYNQMKG